MLFHCLASICFVQVAVLFTRCRLEPLYNFTYRSAAGAITPPSNRFLPTLWLCAHALQDQDSSRHITVSTLITHGVFAMGRHALLDFSLETETT